MNTWTKSMNKQFTEEENCPIKHEEIFKFTSDQGNPI